MERFANQAAQAVEKILGRRFSANELELPPDPAFGDFGFPCFKLAKEEKKSPAAVAQELAEKIAAHLPPEITSKAVGPYVNFLVKPDVLTSSLLSDILKGENLGTYGSLPPETRGSWVLEYSSPNVAKPLNSYHLRPTALGAALDRIGRFRGFKVVSINHLGDWGKQYGMLAVAFKKYGKTLADELSMRELVDLYVQINADAKEQPEIQQQARDAFLKLEQNDPEMTALWKKCVQISLRDFDRLYARLGVSFDHIWGESFYRAQLAPLTEALRKSGLLVESEGAWVVPLTDEGGRELPPCIVQKSDGATLYATRDLAAAIYRYEHFKFDRMTYIVGGEQKLHFQQIFLVLKKMGLPWADRCEHVPFGLYKFKGAKMSTRKGIFVTLEDVLMVAKERVFELMEKRVQDAAAATSPAGATAPAPMSIETKDQIAEAVAVGAVVFHDLHTDPVKDVDFDVDRVVDFEGETGPYLQYAHTRCKAILRKATESGTSFSYVTENSSLLTHPAEMALLKTLGRLPLHLERTLSFSKASQLAHYLIEVTKLFGNFYRDCRVLGDDPKLTQARLMLVEATRRILARGLTLLGVPLPERM